MAQHNACICYQSQMCFTNCATQISVAFTINLLPLLLCSEIYPKMNHHMKLANVAKPIFPANLTTCIIIHTTISTMWLNIPFKWRRCRPVFSNMLYQFFLSATTIPECGAQPTHSQQCDTIQHLARVIT